MAREIINRWPGRSILRSQQAQDIGPPQAFAKHGLQKSLRVACGLIHHCAMPVRKQKNAIFPRLRLRPATLATAWPCGAQLQAFKALKQAKYGQGCALQPRAAAKAAYLSHSLAQTSLKPCGWTSAMVAMPTP